MKSPELWAHASWLDYAQAHDRRLGPDHVTALLWVYCDAPEHFTARDLAFRELEAAMPEWRTVPAAEVLLAVARLAECGLPLPADVWSPSRAYAILNNLAGMGYVTVVAPAGAASVYSCPRPREQRIT